MGKLERGKGQGQGNDKEGDGGTDFCYCTKCSYKMKHDRGTPCNDLKCPECGASMTGTKSEMKLETKELSNVEIFETGVWKGHTYTNKDLAEMKENFDNGVAEPYITVDHNSKATGQFKDALKALALGFVKKLDHKGNKLVASFKQVPKVIAELIEAGPLKKKSIEFYRHFIANGKPYNNVLQGVTFHGANGLPEVNTLSDFLSLYKSNLQTMDTSDKDIVSISNKDKEVEKPMDKIELKQDEYQEMLKKVSQVDVLSDTSKSQAETITTLKSDSVKIMKENEMLKLKQEDIDKKNKESLKSEAEKYIAKKVNDGIILPAHKDFKVEEYITFKADDEKFKIFIADIESRGKVINLDPTKIVNADPLNFKYDPEKVDFKVGSEINYDEAEKTIQAVMKAKKLSWEDAAIECNFVDPAEINKDDKAVK